MTEKNIFLGDILDWNNSKRTGHYEKDKMEVKLKYI